MNVLTKALLIAAVGVFLANTGEVLFEAIGIMMALVIAPFYWVSHDDDGTTRTGSAPYNGDDFRGRD